MMQPDLVTEAMSRKDNELYYGTLQRRRGRVIFRYTDLSKAKRRPGAMREVRRSYPDVLEFSQDWRIISQLLLDCDHG
jgi:hypothetical protein